MSPRRTFATNLQSVTVTTPAGGGTVLLPNTVVSNAKVGVYVASTGVQLTTSTSAASSSNVQVTTDSVTGLTALTFDATVYGLGGGVVLNVFYTFTMAPAVEAALYGNPSPGFYNTDMLGRVGVIKVGRVFTNCFDPQANWYAGAAATVKVIAGGLFTDAANGATGFVPNNATILSLPTPSDPWLGLELGV
jgi:hypothetical protein